MASGIADPVARIVSSMFTQPLRRSPDGQGIIVGTDQALGYAATLGLSLAVYRLVAAMMKGSRRSVDEDRDGGGSTDASSGRGILTFPSFLLTFLRAALFRKIQDGDSYHRAAHGRDQKKGNAKKKGEDLAGPDMQHRGGCHCGSIRFTLCAPRNIAALDCGGKIRYPHYPTTADKFQLTKGSRHLKMYYVTVNNVSEDGSPTGTTCMAAHTFCGRCGVNLLRAPDSTMDALEVNVGCLERDGYATVDVEYYRADDKVGLGAGAPLPHQWLVEECDEPKPAVYCEGDEDCTTLDGTHCPIHVDDISTFWPTELEQVGLAPGSGTAKAAAATRPTIDTSSEGLTIEAIGSDAMTPPAAAGGSGAARHPLLKSHSQHGKELDTPSTSASTMSDMVMPLPSRVVVSHHYTSSDMSCQSSIGDEDLTLSVGGSLGVIGEHGEGKGGWTVGGSASTAGARPAQTALPPRSLNKDQMKYFMYKHMHTPSPSSSFNSSDGTRPNENRQMASN